MGRPGIKERWKCPKCGRRVKIFVHTSEPPTCRNTEQHSQTTVRMNRDERTETE